MTSTASMHLPTVWTESVRTVRARTVRVWTVRVRTVRVRTVGQESCAKECWCVRARGIARVLAPHTILCPQVGRNFLEIVKHHWSVWRVWHVWWVAQRGWKRGGARVSHLGAWSRRSLASKKAPWRKHVGVQLSQWPRLPRQAASASHAAQSGALLSATRSRTAGGCHQRTACRLSRYPPAGRRAVRGVLYGTQPRCVAARYRLVIFRKVWCVSNSACCANQQFCFV